ncbi:MAG: alpha/beta hydrolase family protein, partial [Bacteroidota bacterium]
MKKLLHIVSVLAFSAFGQGTGGYQRPPEELAKLLEAPQTPAAQISPDKTWMALLDRSDYPSIEELSRPELRIAGLRINPENFGPSRGIYFIGIKFKNLKDMKEHAVTGLPSSLQISHFTYAPDSKKAAFLQTTPDKIELWVIDLTSFAAKKISGRSINATLAVGYSWLPKATQLVYAAANNEGKKMTERTRVPSGPVVEENLGKKAPNRTYQDLLKNPYDEASFDFYTTAQLTIVSFDGVEKTIGKPGIFSSFSISPDGKLILTKEIHRPYSYLVPASLFPQTVSVMDINGNLISKVAELPLADNLPMGFNATLTGPRGHAWRNDQPATLYWAETQDGGDPKTKTDTREHIYQLSSPFAGKPQLLTTLPLRFGGITWGNEKIAWVYESWWADRKSRVYQIDPSDPAKKKVVFDRSYEDSYTDPGDVVMQLNNFGKPAMLIQDNAVYLTGEGASPDGDRPFLDRMDLSTGKTTRLWRSEAPYFESVVSLLDAKKNTFLTSRESQTENPNYFVRTANSKNSTQVTQFPHPYPQLKEVKKQLLKYKRADGVELTADLYLPPGYKKEDGPLPTFLWAYPQEFKSKATAGQVKGSPYSFTRIGWGSAIYWVVRGYAILDNASIPIVGEGDKEPNDTYVEQLVSSAKAAIDYGVSIGVVDPNRVGVGGHSYGAFMTANLLAHSDLFKAGIARSGAYNRTLTPFGFQQEERTYWEAPEVYYKMSPFSYADKIKEPILLVHGEADNNSGTFPIQTERF